LTLNLITSRLLLRDGSKRFTLLLCEDSYAERQIAPLVKEETPLPSNDQRDIHRHRNEMA
jgi:hypothetical protein